MAKKRSTKRKGTGRKKKSPLSLVVIVALVIAGTLFFAKYKDDGAFKASVDSTIGRVSEKAEEISEIIDVASKAAKENAGRIDENKEKKEAEQEKAAEQPEKTAQKPRTAGKIALPDKLEFPMCAGSKNGKDHQIRNFDHYEICYRESYEQAEWSAYELRADMLVKNTNRTDDFRADPKISTGSSTPEDFKGTGYDRGHLTPAADMAFDKKAMSETFYMSNMSPQAAAFNRGIWQKLESEVRTWTKKFGKVYVVSGPVLEKSASKYEKIGKSNVSIPQFYYKVILAPLYADKEDAANPAEAKDVAAIGFLLPNDACKGKKFWDFACTVDEVESRTGIDFYPLLDDATEKRAESTFDISLWK